MTGQEHKSISKENILSQGFLLDAKGQGWVVLVTKIFIVMESKGIFTDTTICQAQE